MAGRQGGTISRSRSLPMKPASVKVLGKVSHSKQSLTFTAYGGLFIESLVQERIPSEKHTRGCGQMFMCPTAGLRKTWRQA